jgi:hypothetical protein
MLRFFRPITPKNLSVEEWAERNKKKASADDLIAGAIVSSFAKHYKSWKFEGEFHQRHDRHGAFKPTSLSLKLPTKKHISIVFLFKKTDAGDTYSTLYKYKVIGCEVNGVQVSQSAFKYIYSGWQGIVVQVKRTEQVAEEARKSMEENEKKWDLAEALLGMKRGPLGQLVPIKTIKDEPVNKDCDCDLGEFCISCNAEAYDTCKRIKA